MAVIGKNGGADLEETSLNQTEFLLKRNPAAPDGRQMPGTGADAGGTAGIAPEKSA